MKPKLAGLREEYAQQSLELSEVAADPLAQFERWMREALEAELPEPNALTLSTVDEAGQPHSRVVLLKGLEESGFVFYTNYQSRKGQHLLNNPKAAMNFLWLGLERQVTVLGTVEKVTAATSDEYFASRPRGSRIGAWTSPQSQPIEDRKVLEARAEEFTARFEGGEVPRPEHWGGYRLVPHEVEFWQGRRSRLHDRVVYTRQPDGSWTTQRLAP